MCSKLTLHIDCLICSSLKPGGYIVLGPPSVAKPFVNDMFVNDILHILLISLINKNDQMLFTTKTKFYI